MLSFEFNGRSVEVDESRRFVAYCPGSYFYSLDMIGTLSGITERNFLSARSEFRMLRDGAELLPEKWFGEPSFEDNVILKDKALREGPYRDIDEDLECTVLFAEYVLGVAFRDLPRR